MSRVVILLNWGVNGQIPVLSFRSPSEGTDVLLGNVGEPRRETVTLTPDELDRRVRLAEVVALARLRSLP